MRRAAAFLFVLGALTLAAGPALAFGGKRKSKRGARKVAAKIKDVSITDVRRGRLNLSVLAQGKGSQKVDIYYVKGRKREKLESANMSFGTGRGRRNSASVNLGRRSTAGAHLEVVVDKCKGSRLCTKKLQLDGGDLVVEWGTRRFERRGRDTIWKAKVTNKGPGKSDRCTLRVSIAGRKKKDFRIPPLRAGASHDVSLRYSSNEKRKPLEAKLRCNDLAPKNNRKTDRTK